MLKHRKEEFLSQWISDKLKHTYVWMKDRYKDCDFEHEGWIK